MKTSLRILGILLLGLFAISTVGCERKEDPPPPPITPVEQPAPASHEEKLAGEYELIRLENNENGVIEVYEPPTFEGNMILVHGGSMYTIYIDEGDEHTYRSDAWSATTTTITYDEKSVSYTLQGKILTITGEHDDVIVTEKWKKK